MKFFSSADDFHFVRRRNFFHPQTIFAPNPPFPLPFSAGTFSFLPHRCANSLFFSYLCRTIQKTTHMRKIIGIGETIMDIIFQQGQPTAAVPGGSVFNGIVSLARLGLPVTMLSETGNDRVGRQILDFMTQNGIDNRHVAVYQNGRSAISLAFLNDRNDAE